jgi:hypothetical protein
LQISEIDTSIFVSGLINPPGAPGAIVGAMIEGKILAHRRYGGASAVSIPCRYFAPRENDRSSVSQ